MQRIANLLAVVIAAAITLGACNYKPPVIPETKAVGANPHGLKIEVPVGEAKQLGTDTNNDGKIGRDERNAAALASFQQTVIHFCRWMIGLVTLASIAALVLSFTKWSFMSAGQSLLGFAVVGGIMVGQLALLKWGETLADIAGIATVASAIVAAGCLVWYIVAFARARIMAQTDKAQAARRAEIEEQAAQLTAEGKPREAVALLSTVNDGVNARRGEVAKLLEALPGMSETDKAKAIAKLKSWGVLV